MGNNCERVLKHKSLFDIVFLKIKIAKSDFLSILLKIGIFYEFACKIILLM